MVGYRGTSELFIALERGEIEMTATSNAAPIAKLLAGGKFKILVQSGALKDGRIVARAEFGDAALMPVLVSGRIKDPIAAKGFDYWMTTHTGPDKWLALPPATPDTVVQVYREAFRQGRVVYDAAQTV